MRGRRSRPGPSLLLAAAVAGLAWPAGALDIGEGSPDVRATTISGQSFSISETQKSHRAVAVVFLSTLCPYSNYYNDLLRDMAAEYASRGVAFVGINSSRVESLAEIKEHAREHGHTFPIVRDADGRLAKAFDARWTPEVFLLDAEGKLRYRGRIASKMSSPDLKNALEALLAGHDPRPAETKAFGCAIPRG
jgi:peroxiredoxin